jgi:biopolymer transport protein ExbB
LLEFLIKGGIVLLPIVALSVIALALIIERIAHYVRIRERSPDLGGTVIAELKLGNLGQVLVDLEEQRSPEAGVLLEGLRSTLKHDSHQTIRLRMEAQALRRASELEKNVPFLSSIANLATLLGLLGTVTGMIVSFLNLKDSGIADPALLAGGISQALITTAAGLSVAIPCLLSFHVFRQIVNRTVSRMEIATSELLSYLSQEKI